MPAFVSFIIVAHTYDAASQLTRLAHQRGATSINAFDYVYDRVGNRTSKSSRDGAHNYTYDTLNRLTQAVNPLPTNPLETFNYDPVGNRTNSNQNGASIFNTANQLLEDANFIYQYDNNGNQIRKMAKAGGAVTQFEYDAENKLVRVVSPSNTANYKYDGLGRRVEKQVIAGTTTVTKYLYDNEDILLELNAANQIVARYTHGPGIDEPLITEKNSQAFYYHADGLGNITELTNQSGTVVQRYTYSSFGKIESLQDPNFVPSYTYTGRELDGETELYFYRTRSYDPKIARFIQEDSLRFSGGDTNFYAYVGNNPVKYSDPNGEDWVDTAAHYSAGLGDALLLGTGQYFRDLFGIGGIDQCSDAYKYGGWTSFAFGASRLTYAGLAKAGSLFASSGLEAAAFRQGLKTVFRFGIGRNWRLPNLAKYSTDEALRAAAGRTNPYINAYGAGVAAAGGAGGSGCGCN